MSTTMTFHASSIPLDPSRPRNDCHFELSMQCERLWCMAAFFRQDRLCKPFAWTALPQGHVWELRSSSTKSSNNGYPNPLVIEYQNMFMLLRSLYCLVFEIAALSVAAPVFDNADCMQDRTNVSRTVNNVSRTVDWIAPDVQLKRTC